MHVKVDKVGAGLHPKEVVVSIRTTTGSARLTIDERALTGGTLLEVGAPVDRKDDDFLVELPRETSTGAWRVWVPGETMQAA